MIDGRIPTVIGTMSKLKVLDLHSNTLSSTIPVELYNINTLEVLNVTRNSLVGSITSEVGKLSSLKKLDLSSNFLTGSMPAEIMRAPDLTELILSSNEFTGRIPLPSSSFDIFEHPKSLEKFIISDNKFESTISKTIGNLTGIQQLFFDNNDLTGSIPAELGELVNLQQLSLSYNALKGDIPKSMANMNNLSLVHFHGNDLNGNADVFLNVIENFVTDCGRPSSTNDPVICKTCSICCNSEEMCQQNEQSSALPPITIGLGSVAAVTVLLLMIAFVRARFFSKEEISFKQQNLNALQLCGKDSVYQFVLCRSIAGRIVVVFTILAQILIFFQFLRVSSVSDKDNSDRIYTMRCPSNKTDCEDEADVSWSGWVAFVIMMISFVLIDIIKGFRLMYKATRLISIRCFLGGVILTIVSLVALITTAYYNEAIALSDRDIIVNSVILLFVNDIDEKLFALLHFIVPEWLDSMHNEALEFEFEQNDFLLSRNKPSRNEQIPKESLPGDVDFPDIDLDVQNDKSELDGLVESSE
mmetsp:Transcript_6566/g.9711  ORF Transcript_6566/g.9711 Transcript_6566/m.9711 type:complete len:528 (+) Transcript_6566:1-1584(+)